MAPKSLRELPSPGHKGDKSLSVIQNDYLSFREERVFLICSEKKERRKISVLTGRSKPLI
jgi:hypothetical protein